MSNFRNLLSSSLGLEDDAPNVQVNIDTDDGGMPIDNVTEDGEPTPEADEVEIVEDAGEIEEDNEVIEEMVEATDSLESFYLAMESAQLNGGMTQEAAQFAAIGIESIVAKYGATSRDVGVSLESFGENRALATTVSMEGIVQTLKDLWDAIVRKFQELMKKIVDFYQKTIAAAPRIKRRAEAIRKKARSTTGSPKDKEIKTGLFRSLNIQGKAPTAAGILSAMKVVRVDFEKNAKRSDLEKGFKNMLTSAKNANTLDAQAKVANALISEGMKVVVSNGKAKLSGAAVGGIKLSSGFKVSSKNDLILIGFGSLPGNKAMAGVSTNREHENAFDALRDFRIGVYTDNQSFKPDAKRDGDVKFKVLSTGEVENLCEEIIESMNAIIETKTQINKKENTVKIYKKEGDSFIASMSEKDETKAVRNVTKFMNNALDYERQIQAADAQQLRYLYTTSKAILSYCARSLSNHKN